MADQPVTDVDDIPWGDSPPERVATSTPRKCSHPRAHRVTLQAPHSGASCGRCGHLFAADVVRRSRNNRKRGNSIERDICRDLGVTPRGRFGDPVDGGDDSDPYLVQVKSGGFFVERFASTLAAMDGQRRDRPAILVTVDTPGPGVKARKMVTMTYSDWKALWTEIAESRARQNANEPPTSDSPAPPPFGRA